MGIQVEFNPDLALRGADKMMIENRKIEECIPKNLEEGKTYPFLKKDQRNYWIHGEVPLVETKGNEVLSRPRASIQILEATHFLKDRQVYTKGLYKVLKIFKNKNIQFECFDPVGRRSDW